MALFMADLDPDYHGPPEAYDYARRPAAREAVASFQNTGELKVPLVSVAGARDLLISSERHALAYRDLARARGAGELHELLVVDDAAHIDTNAQAFPFVAPLMPHAHRAFEALVRRVEGAPAAV
jgi:hypothetical protein